MTILTSLNIAQQSLVINEAALNVISNNIANVNTEGYSRQRVVLSPGVNYTPIGNEVTNQVYSTTGVDLMAVERYTDTYLTSYLRQQTSSGSYLNQSADIASNVESTMNELNGTGLEEAISNFYEAAQTLSLKPTDSSARQNYVQQAQTLTLKFNDISNTLTDLRTSLVGDGTQDALDSSKISGQITQVNQKLQELADINSDIIKVGSADLTPNSLLDKRDSLLKDISELMPVSVTENTNGTINLSLNGIDLVNGTDFVSKFGLNTGNASTPAVIQLLNSQGQMTMPNINSYFDSGSIGAILDMSSPSTDGSLTIPDVLEQLDDLASGFAGTMNTLQTTADADGTPMAIDKDTMKLVAVGTDDVIFESSTGGAITAGNIQINADVLSNPYLVATARVDIATYQDTAVGNNSNMIKILNTRTSTSSSFANSTPEGYISNMVSEIGLKTSAINNSVDSQKTVISQVESRLASATGVNMNEELMDLTKYQTAYQASARIYTVCNSLLDILINLGK